MMGSCKHLLIISLNPNKLKKGNYVKLKWVTKKKKSQQRDAEMARPSVMKSSSRLGCYFFSPPSRGSTNS